MKKLTSVVLSVLMVVSLFSCLFTGTTVSAEGTASTGPQNLITNGDFETYAGINNDHDNSAIPALAYRNVATVFPTDKVNGQWYRSTGGISPIKKASDNRYSPDLDESKLVLNATDLETKYPTYFGANNQMVVEPGNTANHVLRIVQDCYTQIDEPENGGTYTLSFKFRIPTSETSLKYLDLQYISPKLNLTNGNSIQNDLKNPYSITNPTNTVVTDENGNDVTSNCTFSSLEATNNNNTSDDNSDDYKYKYLRIVFSTALTDSENWYTAKVTFTTTKNDDIAQPMSYTHTDGKTYTSPIALKLSYSPFGVAAIGDVNTVNTVTDAIYDYYTKNALYLDNFTMYENVNAIGDAEFYNIKGEEITNEQAYVGVTTAVNGANTSTIYAGDKVTATVNYDNTSGAYTFLGWYNNAGVKVSTNVAYTFTAKPGETYTPHFGSVNLLGSSGSFENIASETHLRMDTPTTDNPNFPTGNKWGFNVNAGYFGKTWEKTIYDKDGISYQQTSYGSIRTDRLVTTQCNVLDNASIAKSGSKFLRFDEAVPVSLGLDNLEKHTDYVLSFYLRYSGANTNKINNIGITTTVNISDKTLDTVGMKTSLENAIPNHKIVVAKCDTTELNNVTTDEWQKMTFNFNSGNLEKLYLVIRSASGATLNYYLDDMVLVKADNSNSVAANVEFKGASGNAIESANEYGSATVTSNFNGTYTASVDYDRDSGAYAFDGWYYETKKVSENETFDLTAADYADFDLAKLKAVIISANLLTGAASFENYGDKATISSKAESDTDVPTGDNWKMVTHFAVTSVHGEQTQHYYSGSGEKSEATSYTAGTVSPRSGNVMLRFPTHYQTAVRAITVDKNTDYKLTFYVNAPDAYSTFTKIYLSTVFSSTYGASTMSDSSVAAMKNLGEAFYGSTYDEWKEWKKVELEFNSGDNETLYLCLLKSAAINDSSVYNDCFVDDMSLVKLPSANVQLLNTKGQDITAQCPNEIQPAITNSTTKPGYLVADASNYEDGAFEFKGWYDDDTDTLITPDKSFEFVNGAYTKLTAKVVSRNILSSTASFESYEVNSTTTYEVPYTDTTTIPDYPSGNLWGTSANKGYYNATYAGTIKDNTGREYTQSNSNTQVTTKIKAAVSDAQYKSGSKSLRIDFNWRAASLGIEVTPNTDYTLSYYWYTDKGQNIFEKLDKEQLKSAVVTTLNVGEISPANANDDSGKTIIGAFPNFLHDSNSPITLGAASSADRTTTGGEWKKVTISFNSGDLSTVYLVLSPGVYNKTENGQTDNRALGYVWIDDLTCYANNMTAADLGVDYITEYKASNMRSGYGTVKQALRHQFAIKTNFIDGFNSDLYGTVVEYGSVAIPTSYLGNSELVKDGTYNGKSPASGIAYQKNDNGEVVTNKIFKINKNEGIVTFTAALTGIGANNYDRSYTVRNYVILKKDGKETVVYGDTVKASIFDIMNAILTKYQTETTGGSVTDQTNADFNTVKNILNSEENVTIKTAFLGKYSGKGYDTLLD